MSLQATTSQTVGPFFKLGLQWLDRDNLAGEGVSGERVIIQGRVLDGDGAPVPDAILEIWQANAHGKYDHPEDTQDKLLEPAFKGYGRIPTDKQGIFRIATIKPGPVPGPNGKEQAPHLVISVFMRGLLKRLVTRMYFPDEARNAGDPILNLVDPARRTTLIAKNAAAGPGTLEWNVVLQGPDETVFFDLGL
ncbi:MAG TPA: protocatechuate 3,4-dioxygenase subunit alpha [Terriglobales bacterium]|nr:protocatechuate 3,4-dioxygenase subunit alpha [Terriglobales bacterium]